MELKVVRTKREDTFTSGELYIDNVFECYTLEDKDRGLKHDMPLSEITKDKVYGKTAIPTGRYRVEKIWWEKHQRNVPHIMDVPGYGGILIHSGVTSNDTLGCILVGETIFNDALQNSMSARKVLDAKIFAALEQGEVWITII